MNYLPALNTSFTSFILLVVANTTFAQSIQTEAEIIQEAFGLDKKVAVGKLL